MQYLLELLHVTNCWKRSVTLFGVRCFGLRYVSFVIIKALLTCYLGLRDIIWLHIKGYFGSIASL